MMVAFIRCISSFTEQLLLMHNSLWPFVLTESNFTIKTIAMLLQLMVG